MWAILYHLSLSQQLFLTQVGSYYIGSTVLVITRNGKQQTLKWWSISFRPFPEEHVRSSLGNIMIRKCDEETDHQFDTRILSQILMSLISMLCQQTEANETNVINVQLLDIVSQVGNILPQYFLVFFTCFSLFKLK